MYNCTLYKFTLFTFYAYLPMCFIYQLVILSLFYCYLLNGNFHSASILVFTLNDNLTIIIMIIIIIICYLHFFFLSFEFPLFPNKFQAYESPNLKTQIYVCLFFFLFFFSFFWGSSSIEIFFGGGREVGVINSGMPHDATASLWST